MSGLRQKSRRWKWHKHFFEADNVESGNKKGHLMPFFVLSSEKPVIAQWQDN